MSKIQEMIDQMCPNGVVFVKLGEIAKCYSGATPSKAVKDYWEGGTISWMNSGEVNQGRVYYTENKITQRGFDSCSTKMVPPHTVVIALAGQGKTRGTVAITEIELCTNQSLCAIEVNETIDSYFLWHYLKGQYQALRRISSGDGTRGGLNQEMIRSFEVPVPPLEVQREIVKILDNFSELTAKIIAELTKELAARKKQYEYYRDQLLSFNNLNRGGQINDIQYLKLSSIASFSYGYTDTAKDLGDYRFIRITDIDENGKLTSASLKFISGSEIKLEKYILKKNDLLMARTGATYGKTMLFQSEEPSVYASFLIRIRFKETKILPQYYWHFAQSHLYWDQANKLVGGGAQPQFNTNSLSEIVVPIPSISEQERIIQVLDRFDLMAYDLKSCLSAEIKARQQQYEYYRDQLLTFKRAN